MENSVKTIADYRKMFVESRDLTAQARIDSQIDDDYFHGYQLTTEERQALKSRKQPDNVFNRVRPAINGTLGVLKQGKTDPRAYSRNPDDDDVAEVASKVLRYIADKNKFQDLRIDAAHDYLVSGNCASVIEFHEEQGIIVNQVRFEEFFYDPHSRRADFRDARFMGIGKWMYSDDLANIYPDHKKHLLDSVSGNSFDLVDETNMDRPTVAGTWIDTTKKRVMVVEMYTREGRDWRRCVFYYGGILEEGASPYVDEKNRPYCPIVAQSCFVDRENNRYGLVRDMRGPQDEINKRRSKLLHLLNNRQVRAIEPGYEQDVDFVRKEAARPDGVLPFGWEPITTTDMTAGQFNLLAEAKGEIERMGPNPAILGRQGADTSGRAQLVRQQAGMTEQSVIFGGIEEWELRCYRQMWDRAKQFLTEPQWIRITDDDGAPEFLQINEQVMGPPHVGVDPQTGAPMIQPTVVGYKSRPAEMDVDIIIDTVPNTANIEQEQFMALVDLAKVGVNIPPMLLLEASSLPKKREIIDKMKEAQQQPDPAREMTLKKDQADIEQSEGMAIQAKAAAVKSLADSGVDINAALGNISALEHEDQQPGMS